MKTLVIYDSLYGNTKVIAQTIARVFSDSKLLSVDEAQLSDLIPAELVIVGSPTHGGRPKPSTQTFLDNIQSSALTGKKVAAFDTRMIEAEQNLALRLLMKTIGYAAPRIMKILKGKGGESIIGPEGFFVTGKKSFLSEGEKERAQIWAESINKLYS